MFLKKNNRFDILYIIIGIWVFAFMLSTSMISAYPAAVRLLGFLFIGIKLSLIGMAVVDNIYCRQSVKRTLLLVAFTLLVVVEYILADNWLLFELFFIFVFWGDRLDYTIILKTYMYVTCCSIALIAFLHFTGFLIRFDYYTTRMDRPRVTLGFHHPNSLSECIMVVLLCVFLLFWTKRKRIVVFLITLLVLIWVAVFPNTLTVVLTVFFVFIIYGILSLITRKKLTKKQKRRLLILSIILILVITAGLYYIVSSGRFDESVHRQFESLFIRIRLARAGLERYGITLFGTVYESTTEMAVYVNKVADEYFTIDSVYFLLPIRYGIISTLVFLYCYYKSIYYCVKKSNFKLLSVLIAILIMSIVDPFVTNFIMSFLFICSKAYRTENTKSNQFVTYSIKMLKEKQLSYR